MQVRRHTFDEPFTEEKGMFWYSILLWHYLHEVQSQDHDPNGVKIRHGDAAPNLVRNIFKPGDASVESASVHKDVHNSVKTEIWKEMEVWLQNPLVYILLVVEARSCHEHCRGNH